MASESLYQAEEATYTVAQGGAVFLRKLGFGFLGAVNMCMLLIVLMVFAATVGFVLVQLWVEEPVFVRQTLYFDYTDVHPTAIFVSEGNDQRKQIGWIPVGHTFLLSLVLLMPDSDFNSEIGVFQLTAEVISTNGDVISRSSHPCILRFRSSPIRLMQTVFLGIPILLGLSSETQQLTIQILKHKELCNLRTSFIRITLIPRAGSSSLPQLYKAEVFMKSQLPWTKQVIRNWKWTFYVWTSMYIYVMLIMILFCCFKPLVLPTSAALAGALAGPIVRDFPVETVRERRSKGREDREMSEELRRWQRSRGKRKAITFCGVSPPDASNISFRREDRSGVTKESIGDS